MKARGLSQSSRAFDFQMHRVNSGPSGGARGQATEIQIVADFMLKTRERLNKILADNTGQTLERIQADTERDNFMSAAEALEYGIVDKVL